MDYLENRLRKQITLELPADVTQRHDENLEPEFLYNFLILDRYVGKTLTFYKLLFILGWHTPFRSYAKPRIMRMDTGGTYLFEISFEDTSKPNDCQRCLVKN